MAKNSFISMNVAGWRDLAQSLRDLGEDKDIRFTMRKALRAVAEPAADYARSIAPKHSGRMAREIAVSSQLTRSQRKGRRRPSKDEAEVFFGPKSPQAHLIEFGTMPRRHKSGKFVGATPPQPFMRPAWEVFKQVMLEKFGEELGAQVEKSAKRIARRQAKLIRQGGGA